MSRKAIGEFTPSQFSLCIKNGLNINVHDRLNAAAEVTATSSEDKLAEKSPISKAGSNPKKRRMQPDGGKDANNSSSNPTFPRVECSNGAMEALRLCHSAFLSTISTSLGELESSSSTKTLAKILSEDDVMTCMEQMGLSNLAQRALETLSNDDSKQRPQKKKRKKKDHFAGFKGSQEELLAEQEKLLAESARRVQMMNFPMQGKSEE